MAEYIKRDAFIAWLKRIPIKDLSDGRGLCRIIMEEDFKRAIRELPGEMIVDVALVGWISVKDKLPEPEHEFDARNWYLVALSNGVVKELAYEFHNNSIFGYGWRETAYPVTHWMPLPEPPMSAKMDSDAERRNT